MNATRRVYRAIATYDDPLLDTTRHFLTKRSRDRWAEQRREGYPAKEGMDILEDSRPAIPPAKRVDVAMSEPIIFAVDES